MEVLIEAVHRRFQSPLCDMAAFEFHKKLKDWVAVSAVALGVRLPFCPCSWGVPLCPVAMSGGQVSDLSLSLQASRSEH